MEPHAREPDERDKVAPPDTRDVPPATSSFEKQAEPRPVQKSSDVKGFRKKLAAQIVEFEKISQQSKWDWNSRLRIALLQAHVVHIRNKDPFVGLEDLKSLARLETDLEQWIKLHTDEGNLMVEPIEEMALLGTRMNELVLEVFNLFETAMEELGLPDPMSQTFRLDGLEESIATIEAKHAQLIRTLTEKQEDFQAGAWEKDGSFSQQFIELDKLGGSEDSVTKLPYDSVRAFAFQEGVFWDRYTKRKMECLKSNGQLKQNYRLDSQNLEKASALCKKGNYRQARQALADTMGCFSELPYDEIEAEIDHWGLKAAEPYGQFTSIFSGKDEARVRKTAGNLKKMLGGVKDILRSGSRASFNPLRLLLNRSRWLMKFGRYSRLCTSSLKESETLEPSDFREVILTRWNEGRTLVKESQRHARRHFNFHILKNTLILSMVALCGFSGLSLFQYLKKLPGTVLKYDPTGLPVESFKIASLRGPYMQKTVGKPVQRTLTPGPYQFTVKYVDTFPLSLQKQITLGITTDLTRDLSGLYAQTRNTRLEVQHMAKNLIHLQHQKSGESLELAYSRNRLFQSDKGVSQLTFNPAGTHLLSIDWNNRATCINVSDGSILGTFEIEGEYIQEAGFSPDGQIALILSTNGTISLWDYIESRHLHSFNVNGPNIQSWSFLPDSQTLVSLGDDQKLRTWDVEDRILRTEHQMPTGDSAKEDWQLAMVHPDRMSRIPNGTQMRMMTMPKPSQRLVAGRNTTVAASFSDSQLLRIYSGKPGAMKVVPTENLKGYAIALHPTGTHLAYVNLIGAILRVDCESGEATPFMEPRSDPIEQLVFAPSGDRLVIRRTNEVEIVSFPEGQILHTVKDLEATAGSVIPSPNGNYLAIGYMDGGIELWTEFATTTIYLPTGGYTLTVGNQENPVLQQDLQIAEGELLEVDSTTSKPSVAQGR